MKQQFSILLDLLILPVLTACRITTTSSSPMTNPTVTPMPLGFVLEPEAIHPLTNGGAFGGAPRLPDEK
jgi:hypothetical protein